jgi:hypothetical protein
MYLSVQPTSRKLTPNLPESLLFGKFGIIQAMERLKLQKTPFVGY